MDTQSKTQREIKFRAWHKEEKYMTKVLDLQTIKFERGRDLSDYEWMQYTELKDKNDKEIYEGDIAKVFILKDAEDPESELIEYHHLEQVRLICNPPYFPHWALCALDIEDLQYVGRFYQLEVIGNIYENPELLECK